MLLAATMTVALVVQGQTTLRAAPHEHAPRQTNLVPGDWLEVRGERQGYLEVYDHRRERPGYVWPSAVRSYALEEGTAPRVNALVDFFKDAPGQESLGIGYVALYLRTAPAAAIGPEVFEALGVMAERLGRRASARVASSTDGSLAAELEVAESYGVHFESFEREGMTRVCYDGEAFRRVLALGGTALARVHAVLGLTDPNCIDPALGATAALAVVKWRAEILDAVDVSMLASAVPAVTADEKARLRIRRSIVLAELAYFAARAGDAALSKKAGEAARHELELADRSVLADEDRPDYEEAALRVAGVRWAAEPPPPAAAASGDLVAIASGEPGQTCLRLKTPAKPQARPFEHCTYGVVWPSSLRVAPHEAAVAVMVEPIEGWSELLVFHPTDAGWVSETMTPATVDPELGYVELAGFSPDGMHLLVVREWRASGPLGSPHTLAPWMRRTFQVVATNDLRLEREATNLSSLPSSKRWETADWKRGTLALR
jgi:hypothetical protein